jgi:hypothetical protein
MKKLASKEKLFIFISLILSSFFIFIICEISIRFLSEKDKDGNYFLGHLPLLPISVPVNEMESIINRYNNQSDKFYYSYDSILGWTSKLSDDISLNKNSDVIRIAIFGDSFSASAEVTYIKSWESILRSTLENLGIRVEIINFAVGGYGMDQAYLRWHHEGKLFSPDIVLFGFQPENTKRNINLIRSIYNLRTGIPFTKPRFILTDDKSLSIINTPTVPINQVVKLLHDFDNWSLLEYEYFYDEKYSNYFLYRSKFFASIHKLIEKINYRNNQINFYSLQNEPAQIVFEIINQFNNEVINENGKFIIVHFPTKSELLFLNNNLDYTYRNLLNELKIKYNVIDPTKKFLELIDQNNVDAIAGGHYTELGYETIGIIVAKYIFDNFDSLY